MKKPKDPTLVIYGACTVIWMVLAVSKFLDRSIFRSPPFPSLNNLDAVRPAPHCGKRERIVRV